MSVCVCVGGGPRGVLEVYMKGGGGSDGASYCKPKKIHKLKF